MTIYESISNSRSIKTNNSIDQFHEFHFSTVMALPESPQILGRRVPSGPGWTTTGWNGGKRFDRNAFGNKKNESNIKHN